MYNDLDGEVVNLFRVLRDRALAAELALLVEATPFARAEFEGAYVGTRDPVERARRLVLRSYMGHGNISYRRDRTTGFRRNSNRSGTTPAHDWANLPPALSSIASRLVGVVIEERPALELIEHFDGPETLIYADPPYIHATRSQKRRRLAPSTGYAHEMDDEAHAELLATLIDTESMVPLSGYATPLYDEMLAGWRRLELDTHADGARPRTEILWINPAAASAHGLFAA